MSVANREDENPTVTYAIKQNKDPIHVMVAPVKSFPIDPTFPFRRRVNAKDMSAYRESIQEWVQNT